MCEQFIWFLIYFSVIFTQLQVLDIFTGGNFFSTLQPEDWAGVNWQHDKKQLLWRHFKSLRLIIGIIQQCNVREVIIQYVALCLYCWRAVRVVFSPPFECHHLLKAVSVCSKSWRLGSGICAQGSGKEGVPQVPQTLHLLRPGKNCQQTYLILSYHR